jgi:hypothetical protein
MSKTPIRNKDFLNVELKTLVKKLFCTNDRYILNYLFLSKFKFAYCLFFVPRKVNGIYIYGKCK